MVPHFFKFENVTQLFTCSTLQTESETVNYANYAGKHTLTYVLSSLEISCSNSAATILFWSPPTSKVLTCAGLSTLLTLHRFLPIHYHIVSYNHLTLGHSQNLWKTLFLDILTYSIILFTSRDVLSTIAKTKDSETPFYRQSEEVTSPRKIIPVESNSRGRFHINSFVTLK